MCLGVPARVISIDGEMAKVSVGGTKYSAGLHLVENVNIGDYVLLHTGYAIQKISKTEAEETLNFLREIEDKADEK